MSGKNELITFLNFIIRILGELRDRLDLAFSIYDINGDGTLDKKELGSYIL